MIPKRSPISLGISRDEFSQLAVGVTSRHPRLAGLGVDGKSRAELKQLFAELDTDGNGFLDQAEIQAALDSRRVEVGLTMAGAFMSTVDSNHDGMISEDEFLMFAGRH